MGKHRGAGNKSIKDKGISGNGIITTDYTLTTAPAEGSYSEVGISYDIPSDMESVSWLMGQPAQCPSNSSETTPSSSTPT